MGKTTILSTRNINILKDNGLREYLFKPVFSKDGEKIGRVKEIIFSNYEIEGVLCAKLFFFNKIFVEKNYIDRFTSQGIMLRVNPVTLTVGKHVFDKQGKIIGRVKRVNRKTSANNFETIIVKKGFFGKEKVIYPQDIAIIKKNIILKVAVE